LELLAACPSVTSWRLDIKQLSSFEWTEGESVTAAAAKLKCLSVPNACGMTADLGRLLRACPQLEELAITDELGVPSMLLDPNSISYATATAPAIPLRSWSSINVPHELLRHWLTQQPQQPGRTLTRLVMDKAGTAEDLGPVTRLTGLKDLTLGFLSPLGLNTMTSVTRLDIIGRPELVLAACALTGLRELSLPCGTLRWLPSSMSALKQLTCLSMCVGHIKELPAALGEWLPRLQRLAARECEVAAVPASLSGLSHLDLSNNTATHLILPAALADLQELVIGGAKYTAIEGLHHLSGLSLLNVADYSFPASNTCALGTSLVPLRPLSRLRHLNLTGAMGVCLPGSFSVLGALKQLCSLEVGSTTAECWEALAGAGGLPALQQLRASIEGEAPGVAAMEACLLPCTALTRLYVKGVVVEGDEMMYLPATLQQLALSPPFFKREGPLRLSLLRPLPSPFSLKQLPRGLQRLSALEFLDVSGNDGLCQLPSWLSQLRCLEVLGLQRTGVETHQEVLAQMPGLRCVAVGGWDAATVYGRASHLLFGDTARLWSSKLRWD
jgi:Leucine-rich repeat (LRR) protein